MLKRAYFPLLLALLLLANCTPPVVAPVPTGRPSPAATSSPPATMTPTPAGEATKTNATPTLPPPPWPSDTPYFTPTFGPSPTPTTGPSPTATLPPIELPVPAGTPNSTAPFIQGNYAYLGYGQTITILDLANPALPLLAGRVTLPENNFINDLQVAGQYLYLATGGYDQGGLDIFYLLTPAQPVWVGRYPVPYGSGRVIVQDQIAYLNRYTTLDVVDISNPAAPRLVASLAAQIGGTLVRIGDHLFGVYGACARMSPCGSHVEVINVANPATPTLVTHYQPEPIANVYASLAGFDGNTLYLGVYERLLAVDVSNPAAPAIVAEHQIAGWIPYATNDYALAYPSAALQVFDFSAGAPVLGGLILVLQTSLYQIGRLDRTLYLLYLDYLSQFSLQIVNLDDPDNPVVIGVYQP
ncbi:MAG: hypothetical protein L0332_03620 [Chloroflexi bacterium]|nr:hypothetical protein [Chloroflexota bacterium]MCI0575323.1 hypothetical protein [Chloroflexota bacterium]MCI0649788.1 hypothetical protein [Chloroflexota bacterium]MCI0725801.1 hypothetical protein [Chloroflexota bacterium]